MEMIYYNLHLPDKDSTFFELSKGGRHFVDIKGDISWT